MPYSRKNLIAATIHGKPSRPLKESPTKIITPVVNPQYSTIFSCSVGDQKWQK